MFHSQVPEKQANCLQTIDLKLPERKLKSKTYAKKSVALYLKGPYRSRNTLHFSCIIMSLKPKVLAKLFQ